MKDIIISPATQVMLDSLTSSDLVVFQGASNDIWMLAPQGTRHCWVRVYSQNIVLTNQFTCDWKRALLETLQLKGNKAYLFESSQEMFTWLGKQKIS